jgi:broad specificity phosphatase PhoE
MTARLILICHASTDAVRGTSFPADEPIDERGRKRATAFAAQLPRAAQSWTSPELRTRQTAEALGLSAAPLPVLRDCDYGSWTGHNFDDVLAREAAAVSNWLRDPAAKPPGGESMLSLMQRVAGWLDGENGRTGPSIVVTHATIIRAAIVHAIKAGPESFWRIDIAPLSVTQLSGKDGRWNLTCAGCASPAIA